MVKKKQLKQPLFHRVLNHLGLLDMPSKVNCWYCNNDSFLLPGNRDTIYNWYCHMCENRNMTDINGDIIDPSIFDTNNKSDSEHKYCKPIKLRETPCSICVDCQRNQSLVYQFLSEYIPDENLMTINTV
ncbi:hypothetical protein BDB01DRAFT_463993 [Pilobolus umbonatus]|nr:hypothetical protein BDB01DRAFT_463993 [Pilobolus umbonatus]